MENEIKVTVFVVSFAININELQLGANGIDPSIAEHWEKSIISFQKKA